MWRELSSERFSHELLCLIMLRATLKNVNDSHKAGNDSNISLPQSENRINFEYEKYLQFPEMKNPRDFCFGLKLLRQYLCYQNHQEYQSQKSVGSGLVQDISTHLL